MIDFSNGSVFKLSEIHPQEIGPAVTPLLVQGEQIVACFKAMRDFVVFTNKRVIAVNVQGMTGKKRDFTSLPYSKVQAFSIETAGTFDLDAELDLWFQRSGQGPAGVQGQRRRPCAEPDDRHLRALIAPRGGGRRRRRRRQPVVGTQRAGRFSRKAAMPS